MEGQKAKLASVCQKTSFFIKPACMRLIYNLRRSRTTIVNCTLSIAGRILPGFNYFIDRLKPNWLNVWNIETHNNLKSDSGMCYVAGSAKTNETTYCKGCTLGGHMALTLGSVYPNKSDYVYIIPICTSHNNVNNEEKMKISQEVSAVK